MLQWLRLRLPLQGVQVRSLVGELRSHMPCENENINQNQYCNKFNKDFKKKKKEGYAHKQKAECQDWRLEVGGVGQGLDLGMSLQMCVHAKLLQSCPTLFNPLDYSLPVSSVLGFSRQENWSWLPCSPPGDLPHPGVNPHLLCLLHWQVGSLPLGI